MLDENIKDKIISRISSNIKYKKIILFGSWAKGNAHEDSDIDLVVILEENGFSKNFKEKMAKRKRVGSLFYDIKKKIPMDILVYTNDEWDKLNELNSSFIKELNETGIVIG